MIRRRTLARKLTLLFDLALLATVIAGILFGGSAFALLPSPDALPRKTGIGLASFSGTDDYRLGDEWGKRPVTQADLDKASPAFRRAALATATVGGATAFYLGKFGGAHVMATNHHVMPSDSCRMRTARFRLLGVNAPCDTLLGTWPEIDLALFTVRLTAADEAKLLPVGASFRVHDDLRAGQQLLTIGFGVAGNPTGNLMAAQDSDCYVFSSDAEYRLMADPDGLNPGSYRAWSFAFGCDGSHGDSGSSVVDRATGNVVGILWTGRIPKDRSVQSSSNLTKMFQSRDAAIWEQLNYAVPAKKVGEHLGRLLEGSIPERTKQIFSEMLR